MINATNQSMDQLEEFKNHFYSFFRNEVVLFPEVMEILEKLKNRGIVIGTLSDIVNRMQRDFIFL